MATESLLFQDLLPRPGAEVAVRTADRTRTAAGAEAAVSGLRGTLVVVTATAVGRNALLRVVFQSLSSCRLEGVAAWPSLWKRVHFRCSVTSVSFMNALVDEITDSSECLSSCLPSVGTLHRGLHTLGSSPSMEPLLRGFCRREHSAAPGNKVCSQLPHNSLSTFQRHRPLTGSYGSYPTLEQTLQGLLR